MKVEIEVDDLSADEVERIWEFRKFSGATYSRKEAVVRALDDALDEWIGDGRRKIREAALKAKAESNQ